MKGLSRVTVTCHARFLGGLGSAMIPGYPVCARHGAQRHDGAVNRKAKANREVTGGCKSLGGLDDRNS